jgi:hypothetical protein
VGGHDVVLRGGRVIDPESGLGIGILLGYGPEASPAEYPRVAGLAADVVVFDPATVSDRASYRYSTRPTAGIRHTLVNDAFVVRDGEIVPDARPGRPVLAEPC